MESDRSRQRASKAPAPRPWPSPEEVEQQLNAVLQDYALGPLNSFTAVLEGTTDLRYLAAAASLHQADTGENLLAVPDELGGGEIDLVTPGKPGAPHRGGVARMVPLARDVKGYVFPYPLVQRLLFVFDHDEAGLNGQQQIAEHGFVNGTHSLTLDPRQHPEATARKGVTIEQLLSLKVQAEFFAFGDPWCSCEYEAGMLVCYRWGHESKAALCDFVCENASVADMSEVVVLLRRIRKAMGFAT
jgi:hypothetical protein